MNGVVVYKSRYGTTQQYAEWVRDELRIPMIDPERLDDRVLSVCDFLLIGTPVYMGKMLIRDWLGQNEQRLRGTRLFLFIVCTYFSDVEKQRVMIKDNIPDGLLASCEVCFLPGRLIIDNLTSSDAMLLDLAAPPKPDEAEKETAMQAGDPVQEGNIIPLLETVRSFATGLKIDR